MEPSNDVKKKILEHDLDLWRNTLYQATVRARVAMKVGNKDMEAASLKDAENAQKMLDGFEAELASLT